MKQQHKYTEVSLGRPAVFYLPSDKMATIIDGQKCRDMVTEFLKSEYGGFTDEGNSHNGFWLNSDGHKYEDKYQRYQVSFKGKRRIPKLKRFLAYLAKALDEECIFLQTGEDAFLIYPAD